jgi:hypothetical protein
MRIIAEIAEINVQTECSASEANAHVHPEQWIAMGPAKIFKMTNSTAAAVPMLALKDLHAKEATASARMDVLPATDNAAPMGISA